MSDDIERRLHDQLFAVGTLEPPPGLADAALREAKQRRHKGITAVATAAAAVLAIAIAVPLSVRHSSAGPTTLHPGPAQRNLIVSYTTGVSKSNPSGILMVLNPKTGKYVESKLPIGTRKKPALFEPSSLIASPDGQHYVSSDGRYVGTLTDVINGNVAGFQHLNPGPTNSSIAPPLWSADSSRLLIPIQGKMADYAAGFRIYDPRTNKLGKLVRPSSAAGQVYGWYADDTGFVGFAEHSRLDFFDLDGTLQHTVAIAGRPDFFSVISPDGRRLDLGDGLYDRQTGHYHPMQHPSGKPITVPAPVGWLDNEHYVVDWHFKAAKDKSDHLQLVLSSTGKLLKSIHLPYGTSAMPKTPKKNPAVQIQLGYGTDYPPHSGLRL